MAIPKLICLTPCRNENWIVGLHLLAASQWADHIIIGDQMSDDGTRETVSGFPKAQLVDNPSIGYNEGERHRVVFEAARRIPGPKIFLSIDADELLSANWQGNPEWDQMLRLPPGTAIYARWANLNPDFQTWFPLGDKILIGVVDDGKIGYSPGKFHVPRLQPPPDASSFVFESIRLLHYQYADSERSQSKNRGYQVQEWVENPHRPIRLFRRFNSTLKRAESTNQPIQPEWVAGFARMGFDWKNITIDHVYRWDREVLNSIIEHGANFFRKLDIWDAKWVAIAKRFQIDVVPPIRDPRTLMEKAIHVFLRRTQSRMSNWAVRSVQLALRPLGW